MDLKEMHDRQRQMLEGWIEKHNIDEERAREDREELDRLHREDIAKEAAEKEEALRREEYFDQERQKQEYFQEKDRQKQEYFDQERQKQEYFQGQDRQQQEYFQEQDRQQQEYFDQERQKQEYFREQAQQQASVPNELPQGTPDETLSQAGWREKTPGGPFDNAGPFDSVSYQDAGIRSPAGQSVLDQGVSQMFSDLPEPEDPNQVLEDSKQDELGKREQRQQTQQTIQQFGENAGDVTQPPVLEPEDPNQVLEDSKQDELEKRDAHDRMFEDLPAGVEQQFGENAADITQPAPPEVDEP